MFDGAAAEAIDDVVAKLPSALADWDMNAEAPVLLDRIRALEALKAAAAAAQARAVAAFAAARQADNRAAGVRAGDAERGVAAEVALARRITPWLASREVGYAKILTTELPATFDVLAHGGTNERRAFTVAKETLFLSREDRAAVDQAIAPRLEALGDRQVEAAVRRLAYARGPAGFVARSRAAEKDRRVSFRPAPDVMGRTTTLTTAAQTVAMYAALSRHADAACAAGDPRTRGQIMADTVVERVTGQVTATDVPVAIGLLMTDADLLAAVADRMGSAPTAPRTDDSDLPASDADDSADDPDAAIAESDGTALLGGYGPVPAALAREWVFAPRDAVPRWLRRLYTAPGSGELIAMDSRRRLFTPGQRAFIAARDQVCRTPWCGAPIRQIDHIVAAGRGGPTAVANGQGLCQACDNAKQAPGWGAVPAPPGRAGPHTVTLTTPTGHRYVSRAPDLPSGRGRPRRAAAPLAPERLRTPPAVRSPVERVAVDLFFGDPRRSRCRKADAA